MNKDTVKFRCSRPVIILFLEGTGEKKTRQSQVNLSLSCLYLVFNLSLIPNVSLISMGAR